MSHISEFSLEGQQVYYTFILTLFQFALTNEQWVKDALVCLQEALVPVVQATPRPTCNAVRSAAFASHPKCYLNNTFSTVCFLPSDWPLVMNIVGVCYLTLYNSIPTLFVLSILININQYQ